MQHGGPLGALLSCLTLWPIVEKKIESKLLNYTQRCCYLDDGIIAGTETELNKVLGILTVSSETFGLELRRDKCEVWSKGLYTIRSIITRYRRVGFEILGAALGSPRFLASSIKKRVHKIEKLLEKVEYINDPSVLMAFYVVAWVHQKWRWSRSEEAVKIFQEFDSLQRITFENILYSCPLSSGIKHVYISIRLELESDERLNR